MMGVRERAQSEAESLRIYSVTVEAFEEGDWIDYARLNVATEKGAEVAVEAALGHYARAQPKTDWRVRDVKLLAETDIWA